MIKICRIAPSHSIFFIAGGFKMDPPEIAVGASIAATTDCISVGTLMGFDGETQITFGLAAETALDRPPDFDGYLNTPTHTVVVSTVEQSGLFVQIVDSIQTRVRIWLNRPQEPDDVVIGLG